MFETPNSSLSYNNQQDEDLVSLLIQRISKLETIISKLLNIDIESLEVTNIECSLPNISTRMLTLEKMVHDRVQPSQFNEKEQSCVKLAYPPTQTSNKRKNKNRKNAVFPDTEERDIPTVPISFLARPLNLAVMSDLRSGV